MVRIRFHGRGGHGVKTASRIVGTAAFLEGFQVQDSPIYGAERRGAPVTAFARIDREPILERGAITAPDLIIVADRTLLEDATAHLLAGQESASAVFVNADSNAALAELAPKVVSADLTTLTLATLGRVAALSSALGSAAARLSGCISEANLNLALVEELEHLGLSPDEIDHNADVGHEVFAMLAPVEFGERKESVSAASMHRVGYDAPRVGSPSVFTTGNAELRHTGSWRVEAPEIDYERCSRCGLCFVRCPDGAISLDEHGYPVIDYDHCKGCMICRQICPLEGIATRKETETW